MDEKGIAMKNGKFYQIPRQEQRGQSLLEIALVLPILLILVMGLLEFGRVFIEYMALTYATDHVAQAASRLGGNDPALSTVLQNSRIAFLNTARVQIEVDVLEIDGSEVCDGAANPACRCEYGQVVRVSSRYDTGVRILFVNPNLRLQVQSTLFCWRGGAP